MKKISAILIGSSFLLASACSQSDENSANSGMYSLGGGYASNSNVDPGTLSEFQNVVGDRVLFEVDQSNLNGVARAVLGVQANWLIANQDFRIVVEGHADEQGTREYNVALGARRANAVREYLISLGVAENRIETVSFGKERPIEICSAESCYSKNRRAVSVLNNFS